MVCSTEGCGSDKIFARGLCQKCYNRLRRRGTVVRAYVVNTGHCSVEGCGKPSFAKNLCAHHYEKAQHPLNHTWRIIRSRYPGEVPASWNRFAAFLADVGERPSPKHQLRRILASQPYSGSNIRWASPLGKNKTTYTPTAAASYDRAWNLRRKYGLTVERYGEILTGQGGVCACCRGVETHVHKSGKLKDLAVDHDHATGTVRGLLCFNCNSGIGRLKDDPALLRAAAAYLERYAVAPAVPLLNDGYSESAPIDEAAWASLMPAGVVG